MLKNNNGIIFGVANKRSIAWATAQALHEAGANLAFTYQGERLKENVESLTSDAMPGSLLLSCDISRAATGPFGPLTSTVEQSRTTCAFVRM